MCLLTAKVERVIEIIARTSVSGSRHRNEGCEVGPRGFSRVIIIVVPDYSQTFTTRRSSIIWSERLPCQLYKYIKHQAIRVDSIIPRVHRWIL